MEDLRQQRFERRSMLSHKTLRFAVAVIAAAGVSAAVTTPANAADPQIARFVLAEFGTQTGWDSTMHVRVMADINGDRRADVVGFFNDFVETAIATGDGGFGAPIRAVDNFSFNQGWRVGTHPRFVTDITGDGKADIVGVGFAGVWTAVSNGNGTFASPRFVLARFGANGRPDPFALIAADANHDGRTDLFAFTDGRLDIALARADGTFNEPFLASTEFTAGAYDFNAFKVVNVTGDARPEILAVRFPGGSPVPTFALPRADGTYGPSFVSTNNGNNTTSYARFNVADVTGDGLGDAVMPSQDLGTLVGTATGFSAFAFNTFFDAANDFGFNHSFGYGTSSVPAASLADISGDGRADLVGFNTDGVHTAVSNGNGTFTFSQWVVADFGFNQGWRIDTHPRLLADITGDRRADIIGFGNAGIYTVTANGDGTFTGGGPLFRTVPNLLGSTQAQAQAKVQAAGLAVGSVSFFPDDVCDSINKVMDQNPSAGTQTTVGSAVNFTIGLKPNHPCP
jgi:hypothetical protein